VRTSRLQGLPLPLRGAALGAMIAGVGGGVLGLIIGLSAYPPTAWFAVFELGVPAAVLGGVAGLAAGAIVRLTRRGA